MSGLKGVGSCTPYAPDSKCSRQSKTPKGTRKDTAVLKIQKTLPPTKNRTQTEPVRRATVPACWALDPEAGEGCRELYSGSISLIREFRSRNGEESPAHYGKRKAERSLAMKMPNRLPPPGIWLYRAAPQEGQKRLHTRTESKMLAGSVTPLLLLLQYRMRREPGEGDKMGHPTLPNLVRGVSTERENKGTKHSTREYGQSHCPP